MRRSLLCLLLLAGCGSSLAQTSAPDAALLARTRALYDAPFTRNLVSFDCAVQFDWKQHIIDAIGSLPDSIDPTVEQVAEVRHRISVNHAGAVVSIAPNGPDLEGVPMGPQMEQAFQMVIPAGVNAWLPYADNQILPEGKTQFAFQKTNAGYTVSLNGQGIAGTLFLSPDLRMTGGAATQPQAMNFTTVFDNGPQGYLLRSVVIAAPSGRNAPPAHTPTFTYTYQDLEGFQIPSQVSVTTAAGEIWKYALTDCRITGVTATQAKPSSH